MSSRISRHVILCFFIKSVRTFYIGKVVKMENCCYCRRHQKWSFCQISFVLQWIRGKHNPAGVYCEILSTVPEEIASFKPNVWSLNSRIIVICRARCVSSLNVCILQLSGKRSELLLCSRTLVFPAGKTALLIHLEWMGLGSSVSKLK